MNTDSVRHPDAPLTLADRIFGTDPLDDFEHASAAVLGKLWSRLPTGRGTVLEVRVGWLAGVQYLQFVEAAPDSNKCTASILINAAALNELAACMTDLAHYEGGR